MWHQFIVDGSDPNQSKPAPATSPGIRTLSILSLSTRSTISTLIRSSSSPARSALSSGISAICISAGSSLSGHSLAEVNESLKKLFQRIRIFFHCLIQIILGGQNFSALAGILVTFCSCCIMIVMLAVIPGINFRSGLGTSIITV